MFDREQALEAALRRMQSFIALWRADVECGCVPTRESIARAEEVIGCALAVTEAA